MPRRGFPSSSSLLNKNPNRSTFIAKFRRYNRREITRVNERIRVPRVRVIDSTTNSQLGVMTTQDAIRRAKQVGLDLVEVASNADPPVCKIVDYGKFRYEQSKQRKDKNKAKSSRVKEVKFRVRIDKHDYQVKMEHAEDFLDDGHKVRIQLQFRGREMAHQELGFQMMDRIKEDLKLMAHVDMDPRQAGRNISMMLSPLPARQRKRMWKIEPPEGEETEEPAEDASSHAGDEDGSETDAADQSADGNGSSEQSEPSTPSPETAEASRN